MWHRSVATLAALTMSACILIAPDRATTFGGGDIILQAPSGYCIDPVASRPSDDFAVLAPCAMVGVETAAMPAIVGLVTVLTGAPGSGAMAADERTLRDFLITGDGKAVLSQSGTADDINILSTQAFDDQVMVHFNDQGPPPLDGLQREEWRAFVDVGGRLVTIGVRGLAAAPLQDGPGAGLLKQVIAGLRPVTDGPAS